MTDCCCQTQALYRWVGGGTLAVWVCLAQRRPRWVFFSPKCTAVSCIQLVLGKHGCLISIVINKKIKKHTDKICVHFRPQNWITKKHRFTLTSGVYTYRTKSLLFCSFLCFFCTILCDMVNQWFTHQVHEYKIIQLKPPCCHLWLYVFHSLGKLYPDCSSLESGGVEVGVGECPELSPQSLEYYHPWVAGKGDSPCDSEIWLLSLISRDNMGMWGPELVHLGGLRTNEMIIGAVVRVDMSYMTT